MDRMTNEKLEGLARIINKLTNNPLEPMSTDENGRTQFNGGCYHLSGAYGGKSLHRMSKRGSGTSDVFSCGHIPKRDLYNRMRAFIDGLEAHKNG